VSVCPAGAVGGGARPREPREGLPPPPSGPHTLLIVSHQGWQQLRRPGRAPGGLTGHYSGKPKRVRVKEEASGQNWPTPPPDPPTPRQAAHTLQQNITHGSIPLRFNKKSTELRWGRLWLGYLRGVKGEGARENRSQ
jgi:hypothetical protein